jgi:hypothetical protein
MKSLYTTIILIIIVLAGCERQEIGFYDQMNYIYFQRSGKDIIEYSFAFNPGKNSDTIPIVVRLIGNLSEQDRQVVLSVDENNTDALADDYTLPENSVLRAGRIIDTIPLVLHKSNRLSQKKYCLRLKITDNEYFKCGPITNSYLDITFSDILTKPNWWDSSVESNFLGTYSDAKYKLFIEATGIHDLTNLSESEKRAYALIFRDFLNNGREQGKEYVDEFGNQITVPVYLFN